MVTWELRPPAFSGIPQSPGHSPGAHLPLCCWVTSSSTLGRWTCTLSSWALQTKSQFYSFSVHSWQEFQPQQYFWEWFPSQSPNTIPVFVKLEALLGPVLGLVTTSDVMCEVSFQCWVRGIERPPTIPQELSHRHHKILMHFNIRFHPVTLYCWFYLCVCLSQHTPFLSLFQIVGLLPICY